MQRKNKRQLQGHHSVTRSVPVSPVGSGGNNFHVTDEETQESSANDGFTLDETDRENPRAISLDAAVGPISFTRSASTGVAVAAGSPDGGTSTDKFIQVSGNTMSVGSPAVEKIHTFDATTMMQLQHGQSNADQNAQPAVVHKYAITVFFRSLRRKTTVATVVLHALLFLMAMHFLVTTDNKWTLLFARFDGFRKVAFLKALLNKSVVSISGPVLESLSNFVDVEMLGVVTRVFGFFDFDLLDWSDDAGDAVVLAEGWTFLQEELIAWSRWPYDTAYFLLFDAYSLPKILNFSKLEYKFQKQFYQSIGLCSLAWRDVFRCACFVAAILRFVNIERNSNDPTIKWWQFWKWHAKRGTYEALRITERESWLGFWISNAFNSLWPASRRGCLVLVLFFVSRFLGENVFFLVQFIGRVSEMEATPSKNIVQKGVFTPEICEAFTFGRSLFVKNSIFIGLYVGYHYSIGESDYGAMLQPNSTKTGTNDGNYQADHDNVIEDKEVIRGSSLKPYDNSKRNKRATVGAIVERDADENNNPFMLSPLLTDHGAGAEQNNDLGFFRKTIDGVSIAGSGAGVDHEEDHLDVFEEAAKDKNRAKKISSPAKLETVLEQNNLSPQPKLSANNGGHTTAAPAAVNPRTSVASSDDNNSATNSPLQMNNSQKSPGGASSSATNGRTTSKRISQSLDQEILPSNYRKRSMSPRCKQPVEGAQQHDQSAARSEGSSSSSQQENDDDNMILDHLIMKRPSKTSPSPMYEQYGDEVGHSPSNYFKSSQQAVGAAAFSSATSRSSFAFLLHPRKPWQPRVLWRKLRFCIFGLDPEGEVLSYYASRFAFLLLALSALECIIDFWILGQTGTALQSTAAAEARKLVSTTPKPESAFTLNVDESGEVVDPMLITTTTTTTTTTGKSWFFQTAGETESNIAADVQAVVNEESVTHLRRIITGNWRNLVYVSFLYPRPVFVLILIVMSSNWLQNYATKHPKKFEFLPLLITLSAVILQLARGLLCYILLLMSHRVCSCLLAFFLTWECKAVERRINTFIDNFEKLSRDTRAEQYTSLVRTVGRLDKKLQLILNYVFLQHLTYVCLDVVDHGCAKIMGGQSESQNFLDLCLYTMRHGVFVFLSCIGLWRAGCVNYSIYEGVFLKVAMERLLVGAKNDEYRKELKDWEAYIRHQIHVNRSPCIRLFYMRYALSANSLMFLIVSLVFWPVIKKIVDIL